MGQRGITGTMKNGKSFSQKRGTLDITLKTNHACFSISTLE
jgi:hypothetical protein